MKKNVVTKIMYTLPPFYKWFTSITDDEITESLRNKFETIFRKKFFKSESFLHDSAIAWLENNKHLWRDDFYNFGSEPSGEAVMYGAEAGLRVENSFENGWICVEPVPNFCFLIDKEYAERAIVIGYFD